MYNYPFFTAIDPDSRIKGSRDPLGFESLWTALGREVVQNLTTVTRSVRQFSTLLFGFHFAKQATESLTDRDEQFLPAFLRFEQLAAYARYTEKSARRDIRGIRAVSRHVQENCNALRLSPKTDWQILSDQKTYGIYGLFRVAARNSGLLETEQDTQLTPKTRDHVEQQLKTIGITPALREEILRGICRNTKISLGASIVKATARLLKAKLSGAEVEFYGARLVRGEHLSEPQEIQRRLWKYLEAVNSPQGDYRWNEELTMVEVRACIGESQRHDDAELAEKLDRICRAEELLGAAAMLYAFLLTQDKQCLSAVSQQMADAFDPGLNWLDVSGLGLAFGRAADRLERIAHCLVRGDYEAAVRGLIDRNATVMRDRGGSAWIVLKDDMLDVRLLEEGGNLPSRQKIRHPWVHTYFLNALKHLGGCIYHAQK